MEFIKIIFPILFLLFLVSFLISVLKIFYGSFSRSYSDYSPPANKEKARKIKRDYYDSPDLK